MNLPKMATIAGVFVLTGFLANNASGQAVWNQTGDPIDLPWADGANWDTGVFPNAPGAVVNFTDPTGFVDANAIVSVDQDLTFGQINYQDFVDNGADIIGQSDLQIRSAAPFTLTLDRGDDTMPAINLVGTYNDTDFIRVSANNNLVLAGDDGLAINTGGLVVLDGPNTYTGQTIITGLDSGPDRSGDGRVRVEDVNGLGASGAGNETVVIGTGAQDGFGVNNRLETSLRFGGNEALAGPITEDITFRWTSVASTDNTFARRTWDDAIFVEDDHPVVLGGTITFHRPPTVDPHNGDQRLDFQCGDTGTGNGDENREFLQIDTIVLNDESAGDGNGDIKNNFEFNAVNAPTDPNDPSTGSQIVVGQIFGATPDSDRDTGFFVNGDGTVRLVGDSEMEGDVRVNRGTLIVENTGVLDTMQNVRLGTGGTNGGTDLNSEGVPLPKDSIRFLLGLADDFLVRDSGGTPPNGDILLDDISGGASDEDIGDEVPYVIGATAAGVTRLIFDDITYAGDGWNNNDNKPQLDALNPQIHFAARDGSQLVIAGRIEAPNATDAEAPGNGTVDVTKIGPGTVVLSANPNQPEDHEYNGDTHVMGGALIIDRRVTSDGEVLTEEETSLGGSSTIGSGFANVTLGGNLDPGSRSVDGNDSSEVGELTILGSLDLNAAEGLQFDLGAPGSGDHVVISGALTLGGVIVVRDAGGLATGTYDLFDAAAHSGDLPPVSMFESPPGFTYTVVSNAPGDIDLEVMSTGGGDRDDDGMPDSFETANGLDPDDPADALLDLDGDGSNNLTEYVFGTDPSDPASELSINVPAPTGDPGISVTYGPIRAGVTYEAEHTNDFETWRVFDTFEANADAESRTLPHPATGDDYFRVRGSR